MNLENITEKVKNNFSSHISLASNSEFFTKYSEDFFKDFDIDSPFLNTKEILNNMVEKIKSSEILNNLNIDENSLKMLDEALNKEENKASRTFKLKV